MSVLASSIIKGHSYSRNRMTYKQRESLFKGIETTDTDYRIHDMLTYQFDNGSETLRNHRKHPYMVCLSL